MVYQTSLEDKIIVNNITLKWCKIQYGYNWYGKKNVRSKIPPDLSQLKFKLSVRPWNQQNFETDRKLKLALAMKPIAR